MFDPTSFSSLLITDFTWRVRELSDLKSGVKGSDLPYQATLRRAALPLAYAHWEGHVKFIIDAYLKYVSRRRLQISKIQPNLAVVALHGLFEQISGRIVGYSERMTIMERFKNDIAGQFRSVPKDYTNTGGNLGFERFCELCSIIGVDPGGVVTDAEFLNKGILDQRNHIAHGSDKVVEFQELEQLIDLVVEAMRGFRDQVVNLVALEKYKN